MNLPWIVQIVLELDHALMFWFIQDSDLDKPSLENPSVSSLTKDISSDTHQSCTSQSVSSSSLTEAQRCMSLYFALCTKVSFILSFNPSLLRVDWSTLNLYYLGEAAFTNLLVETD